MLEGLGGYVGAMSEGLGGSWKLCWRVMEALLEGLRVP